jgi:hypothetical protein
MIDEHTVRFAALRGRAGDDVTYTERRVRSVRAPAVVLWQVVHDLGGESGYHAFDSLWRARAALDRAVGGPGMRGRPEKLADGDALDFWRVESVDPPQRLLLRAEMRMPGTARLELRVESLGDTESQLEQRTWFEPSGVVGHAFWWAELPGHKVVFNRLVDGIARAAERAAAAG